MKIVSCIVRMLRYTWASPYSLVGLLLSVVAILFGATLRIRDGTVEVAGGRIWAWVSRLPRLLRFFAITFGHVIFGSSHDLLGHHRSHERVHVQQYERWGILFIPLYFASSLVQFLRGRDPYLGNCFEQEADLHATKVVKSPCDSPGRPENFRRTS